MTELTNRDAPTAAKEIALVAVDHTGTIITWSGHAAEWFGYASADALGRSVESLVPDTFRDAHRAGLERAMSGGEWHLEGATTHLPIRHADGHTVVHPARFHHLTTAQGHLVAATAVFGPPNPTAEPWQPV